MNRLKKAGIIAGATVGGVIGGTISVVGKVAKVKLIDDIGSSIVDSTIYTGEIVGDIASGTTDLVAGKVTKNHEKSQEGIDTLKEGGGKVVDNFVNNFKLVTKNGGEILEGIKEKDFEKISHGTKTLAKAAAVGAMTVGAIKIDEEEKDSSEESTTRDE
ncbi:hypothetical protein [Clostridium aminobutyricum]|uniref:Uncharacterized protein n=1 Tax=Clostridium aminobutyricum TaxID=33953 RepID=A0A939D9B8_CLOAM|nr:hypothetical protein [Clostridium aminobutyricum]MBN7773452.1 hypothetical protein [Clostridium aminobutyricum]